MLFQYFYEGLSMDSREYLDLSSGGVFLHLPISEARPMIKKISQVTRWTSIHDELSKEEEESSPEPEEEVLIVKSQSLPSQDLAVNAKPSKP
jgi:hypothetical protein